MLDARTKGSPTAPITIYEASDFQCPYCRIFFEQTLPLLEQEYIATGKARLVFLNLPLTQIHPNAAAAHEFAMCAAAQNQFWPAHDLLFQTQARWAALNDPGPFLVGLGDSLRVSREQLTRCLESGSVRDIILAEAQMSLRAGIQSTPSFVIEQGILAGAQPIEVWRPILDSLIAVKRK
jgi:protein-disulfide isomerase